MGHPPRPPKYLGKGLPTHWPFPSFTLAHPKSDKSHNPFLLELRKLHSRSWATLNQTPYHGYTLAYICIQNNHRVGTITLRCGRLSCILIRCLIASLVSAHQMPEAPFPHLAPTKNVSRHGPMILGWGKNYAIPRPTENHWSICMRHLPNCFSQVGSSAIWYRHSSQYSFSPKFTIHYSEASSSFWVDNLQLWFTSQMMPTPKQLRQILTSSGHP